MEERGNKVVSLAKYRQKAQAKEATSQDEVSLSLQTKQALAELLSDAEDAPSTKKLPARKRSARAVQTIEGNNNVQLSGNRGPNQFITGNGNFQANFHIHPSPKPQRTRPPAPAPGSIGACTALRLRINALLKEIQRNRVENHGGKFRYGSVQGIAAEALGLGKDEWNLIWSWDESRASEVINKLEQARDNTIKGRINKAARKPNYKHTRGHLFRLEKDYLAQLEWSDYAARKERALVTGEASRTNMSDDQFANWVAHLRSLVQRMYGEGEE